MLKEISVSTTQKQEITEITEKVKRIIAKSGIKEGICVIYCTHTSAAISINEVYDPAVGKDILYALNQIVPIEGYKHSEGNSEAHVKSSLVGASESLIIKDGKIVLGKWQGIIFCEFDGPRERKVLVKIIGD